MKRFESDIINIFFSLYGGCNRALNLGPVTVWRASLDPDTQEDLPGGEGPAMWQREPRLQCLGQTWKPPCPTRGEVRSSDPGDSSYWPRGAWPEDKAVPALKKFAPDRGSTDRAELVEPHGGTELITETKLTDWRWSEAKQDTESPQAS